MKPAYIIDAIRTPIGKYGGALSSVRPDDLAALVIKELLKRNPAIDTALIEDVILGCTNQAGEDNRNVARMASLLAGLPVEVSGATVNRLCGSSMQAIMDATRAIMLSEGDVYIAGGVESMSRAPFVVPKADTAFSRNAEIYDSTIGWRFTNPKLADLYYPYSMGETAENIAKRWKISREEQDEFSHYSQLKYKQAFDKNTFKEEIIPVHIPQRKGNDVIVENDEHPNLSSLEKLASLKPAFAKEGTVTAGNSSGINDGASALMLVSEDVLKKYNIAPLAMVKSMAVAGVHPDIMGIGPVPATQKALKRAGLKMNAIDLIELNEAFAAQSIACIRELNINPEIINVNGGSIALGHPLGATGARVTTTLLKEMHRRKNAKYGLATMCIGVGQGIALILEKC